MPTQVPNWNKVKEKRTIKKNNKYICKINQLGSTAHTTCRVYSEHDPRAKFLKYIWYITWVTLEWVRSSKK